MQELLNGIRDFHDHDHERSAYRERFAHLALGQSPDCLFVACSDSRVVPNVFASTDPGDLFVVGNVGNIVPPSASPLQDAAPGSAVEFAVLTLGVRDIVVCGHSGCGAVLAALTRESTADAPHLARWLAYADASLARLDAEPEFAVASAEVLGFDGEAHAFRPLADATSGAP